MWEQNSAYRVSTSDQKLALQLDALNAAGRERIFDDRASGAKPDREACVNITFV